jgi:hypothetical protein
MDFDLNLGQWIVIALSAFLFVWYFLANSANRRKGIATYRWLRQGMEVLGEVSSAEWIGASNMGARLVATKATKPLRRVEAHYLLEPREFLPYWLVSRLRGKRDEVVIKMALRTSPKGNLEIRRKAGRRADAGAGKEQIHPDFQVVLADLKDARVMAGLESFLAGSGSTVEKIVIQPQVPHLELQARLKPLLNSPAESYFSTLLSWFQDSDQSR